MKIERLRVANNGLVEANSDGPLCWYEDHQQAIDAELEDSATLSNRLQAVIDELQRQLTEARALIADLDVIRYELPEEARYAVESYIRDMPK